MTAEELSAKYTEASWLIAKRSATAAGKALFFDSESVDDTVQEIAALYALTEAEIASLQPQSADGGLANVQWLANGLLGDGQGPSTGQAMDVARTAIKAGKTTTVLSTLFKAGPAAAQAAAAAGGQVVSKGTPWGWIATAGYAAGSAGWFAYNARAFNLAVFELIRARDGIVLEAEPLVEAVDAAAETTTLKLQVPTFAGIKASTGRMAARTSGALGRLFGRQSAS